MFLRVASSGTGAAWEPRVGEMKLKEDFGVGVILWGCQKKHLSYRMIGDGPDAVLYELKN